MIKDILPYIWSIRLKNETVLLNGEPDGGFFVWQDICTSISLKYGFGKLSASFMAKKTEMHQSILFRPILLVLMIFCLNMGPLWAADVHLGSQYTYAQSNSFAEIPIFLTNYKNISINKIRFSLSYNITKVTLDTAILSSALNGWSLVKEEPSADSTILTLEGGSFKDINKMILKVRFLLSIGPGSSVNIRIGNILINDQIGINVSSENSMIINTALPLDSLGSGKAKGDVNMDSKIDYADVQSAFDGLSKGLSSVAEFSGVKPKGSVYDVAILYQHVTGLKPYLPNPQGPLADEPDTSGGNKAVLNIDGPIPVDGLPGYYRYTIHGRNLEGLISAELELQMNADIIEKVWALSIANGNGIANGFTSDGTYKIFWVSPLPVDTAELDWLSIVVQNKVITGEKGFTSFSKTVFNEGQITYAIEGCTDDKYLEHTPEATVDNGSCQTLKVRGCRTPGDPKYNPSANWHDENQCSSLVKLDKSFSNSLPGTSVVINRYNVTINNLVFSPVLFQIISVQGRVLNNHKVPANTVYTYSFQGLTSGRYIVRVVGREVKYTKIVTVN